MFFSNRERLRAPFLHAAFWVAYGVYAYILTSISKPSVTVADVFFFLLPYSVIFYLTVNTLNIYKRRGIIWALVSYVLVFAVMASFGYVYVYRLLPTIGVVLFESKRLDMYLQAVIFGYIQYSGYALIYFYTRESIRKERQLGIIQKEKLEKELESALLKQEKLQYEYAFLRAQTNPHFLINTLNVLYSQAQEHSEPLAANIKTLTDILRYSLEAVEGNSDTVPVMQEITHLQLLLEIISMRFGSSRHVDVRITGDPGGYTVPPHTFITFVENALKHGDLKHAAHPLEIHITFTPEQLHFLCRNKKNKNPSHITSYGIGLKNLNRRLNLILDDAYKLDIIDEEDWFTVNLFIYDPMRSN